MGEHKSDQSSLRDSMEEPRNRRFVNKRIAFSRDVYRPWALLIILVMLIAYLISANRTVELRNS